MKIKIAYMYYDLLNLYGESGNVKVLKQTLESLGINVVVDFITIDSKLDIMSYDLVYMGMGTEENQKLALKHLIKYKKQIKEYFNSNKFFLITGNSIELFGKSLTDINGKKYDCVNIFNYECKEEPFRMADEVLFKCKIIDSYVIGFQNQNSTMKGNDKFLFNVVKGIGSYPNSKCEGVLDKNFFGTYVIGPLLARNPIFVKYFVKKLVLSIDSTFKFKNLNLKLDNEAYNNFLNNYYQEYVK